MEALSITRNQNSTQSDVQKQTQSPYYNIQTGHYVRCWVNTLHEHVRIAGIVRTRDRKPQ